MNPVVRAQRTSSLFSNPRSSNRCNYGPQCVQFGRRWSEYQGCNNWEGLLDPLNDNLRQEILRYGKFVQAAYKAFDFDFDSPSYGTCIFPKHSLLPSCGLPETGYRLTKNLHATSGIQLPGWFDMGPSWMSTQSSWIGYVAVCQDEEEISRLGRRDVVVSFRGTATCLEWLENLRAMLIRIPGDLALEESGSMVESGFWSLFTSGAISLRHQLRAEIGRLLQTYDGQELSVTVTGHSLGAALAILAAYDITTVFPDAPLVTVFSFGGPRVGNPNFRRLMEHRGSKVLRVVNESDLIPKVPGLVSDVDELETATWLKRWIYADVGKELRVRSKDSPYLLGHKGNIAMCHQLEVYLHLVEGFLSSTCPYRDTTDDDFLKLITTECGRKQRCIL